jgi:hypothetical protein
MVPSITIVNVTPQFGAYLYDRKTFTIQAIAVIVIKLFTAVNYHQSMVMQSFCVIKLYHLGNSYGIL